MIRYMLLLLLLAAPVHAATFEWDFTKTRSMTIGFCDVIQTVSNGGITATFGDGFSYSQSALVAPWECDPVQYTGYGFISNGFRNAPSGTWAASFDMQCEGEAGSLDYKSIIFDTPIQFFACDLMGTATSHFWMCPPYVCSDDGGQTWNTHCNGVFPSGGSMTEQSVVQLIDAQGVIRASVQPAIADGWVGIDPPPQNSPGGDFDWSNTLAPYSSWQHVEVFSPVPVTRVTFRFFEAAFNTPMWIDNIVASTTEDTGIGPFGVRAGPVKDETPPPQASVKLTTPPMIGEATRSDQPTKALRTSWGRVKSIYR